MDAIIQGTDEKSQSKNESNHKLEFIEGNAGDVLSKMVKHERYNLNLMICHQLRWLISLPHFLSSNH